MDHIGNAVFISPVGDNADVVLEYYNIPTLPLFYFRKICSKAYCPVFKIYLQISHPSEINVFIRLFYIVTHLICPDILIYQSHQIISGAFQRKCHHICTYAITVIRIACLIIFTFIFRLSSNVVQCTLEDIRLVVYAVPIFVCHAVDLWDNLAVSIWKTFRRSILIPETPIKKNAQNNSCTYHYNNYNVLFHSSLISLCRFARNVPAWAPSICVW